MFSKKDLKAFSKSLIYYHSIFLFLLSARSVRFEDEKKSCATLGCFFLEITLCAKNGGGIIFSVRSENPDWNAARIIFSVLKGIGFGGGHADMAGGIIKDISLFNHDDILNRLADILLKST